MIRTSVLGAVLSLVAVHADAGTPVESGDVAWLHQVQEAAQHQGFVGMVVYQAGNDVHVSEVLQAFDGRVLHTRIRSQDGLARETVRHGSEVQRYFPEEHRVVIEHERALSFPAFAEPVSADLMTHYRIEQRGEDLVAGRVCQIAALVPRDDLRYGYELCVDPRSHLMLRARTFNEQGRPIEQVAFAQVKLDAGLDSALVRPTWSTAGWLVENHVPESIQLERQGWQITPPKGFRRLAQVVQRWLHRNSDQNVVQAVFSDGFATVSVFIEPAQSRSGTSADGESEREERHGPVTAVLRQTGDANITVVGEVPPVTAHRFASNVVRVSAAAPGEIRVSPGGW